MVCKRQGKSEWGPKILITCTHFAQWKSVDVQIKRGQWRRENLDNLNSDNSNSLLTQTVLRFP